MRLQPPLLTAAIKHGFAPAFLLRPRPRQADPWLSDSIPTARATSSTSWEVFKSSLLNESVTEWTDAQTSRPHANEIRKCVAGLQAQRIHVLKKKNQRRRQSLSSVSTDPQSPFLWGPSLEAMLGRPLDLEGTEGHPESSSRPAGNLDLLQSCAPCPAQPSHV